MAAKFREEKQMSEIVTSSDGRFRRVTDGKTKWWLWECPGCKQWCSLSEKQWAGQVSVDHASDGCPGGYHETHNFGASLVAAMQASILMEGGKPTAEDVA
jgi:hypothetical protein